MPLHRLLQHPDGLCGIWNIRESEAELTALSPGEGISATLTHPQKRLEALAARIVTRMLMERMHEPYRGVTKNEFGKPFLVDSTLHISQSHSFPFVAVTLSKHNTGVDIEQPRQNLLRVAPRVFNDAELQNANGSLVHLCIQWCAKETLIKLYGKKDLVLKEELNIAPFPLGSTGRLEGMIRRTGVESLFQLEYLVEEDFVLVTSF